MLPGIVGFDVGSNLDTLLSIAGWDYLTSADLGTLNGFFVGHGLPLGGDGPGVYLAQIPEPATYGVMFGVGLLGFVAARRRFRFNRRTAA